MDIMSTKEKSEFIKRAAKEIGFDLIGITKVKELPHSKYIMEWIKKGYHADMLWMERSIEKRIDIKKIYPEAQSIIVVGENYYKFKGNNYYGCIARYASHEDYHNRIKKKLKHLAKRVKGIDEKFDCKIYVDTGAVMEKLWAVEAGLGWMGKHSNIISREIGSWFSIGLLITNIEMEYDNKAEDHCGRCMKCIEACPTSAIVEPYVVDARKCISYLTIENRSEIPNEFIPKLKGNIFGCDICQEVCPWNKFAKLSNLELGIPIVYNRKDIELLLEMKKEDFNEKYKGYPIKRAKYEGFIRNLKAIYC